MQPSKILVKVAYAALLKKEKKKNEVPGNEKAKCAWQNKLTKTFRTSKNKAKNQQVNNYEHILQFIIDN